MSPRVKSRLAQSAIADRRGEIIVLPDELRPLASASATLSREHGHEVGTATSGFDVGEVVELAGQGTGRDVVSAGEGQGWAAQVLQGGAQACGEVLQVPARLAEDALEDLADLALEPGRRLVTTRSSSSSRALRIASRKPCCATADSGPAASDAAHATSWASTRRLAHRTASANPSSTAATSRATSAASRNCPEPPPRRGQYASNAAIDAPWFSATTARATRSASARTCSTSSAKSRQARAQSSSLSSSACGQVKPSRSSTKTSSPGSMRLIRYDMPWNPMRVEQRIGRIDRLGQARDVVHVRSYFIPGTVEESVYRALASRIDDFRELLGDLKPILGATERAFQSIFKAPRSERRAAQEKIIKQLLDEVDTLRAEGIDFTPEDPMPLPEHPPAPVTLEDLREVLVDRFAAVLDKPDRPVTFDPARASRDPDGWTALATYGHPRLEARLDRMAGASLPDSSALVLATTDRGVVAAVRADRTPPEPIRSLADVEELGPPAARGEAESLANTIALEATAARRAYETQILSARNQRWLDTLRQRFLALVHETLAAGCAALRYEGQEDVDPVTVWHSLGQDATSAWAYARAFQERLRVPLARLFPAPRHPAGAHPTRRVGGDPEPVSRGTGRAHVRVPTRISSPLRPGAEESHPAAAGGGAGRALHARDLRRRTRTPGHPPPASVGLPHARGASSGSYPGPTSGSGTALGL